MQERHQDETRYFEELAVSARKYILPYIRDHYKITKETSVLEIGCGTGGNLKPFFDEGCRVVGVDQSLAGIRTAETMLGAKSNKRVQLFADDLFNLKDIGKFDLIVVRDVIEHIDDKRHFFIHIRQFLLPGGIIYFAFPPWYMPFGGHQQICRSRLLSRLPFFHLLPVPLFRSILSMFGEKQGTIDELLSIKETGITVEQFRRYVRDSRFEILDERLYLINPHYEIKFGLKPRLLHPLIGKISFVRNFFTTGCFYLINSCAEPHNEIDNPDLDS